MCDVAAVGPAIGAVGNAMGAAQANKEKRRQYKHQLKVRERKWMQTRSTYQSKKVQFAQEVDLANIAAQRAYTSTNIQLNRARSTAILNNQEDFKKMLSNEGMIEVSAAERGVRGKSVARQLVMNQGQFGLSQAMRSRALATARFDAKEVMADTNRQLKGELNKSFSKVAVAPIPDFAPPKPVMQNVGMTLMLGMGQALAAGLEGSMANNTNYQNQTVTPPSTINYGNTYPTGSFNSASAGYVSPHYASAGIPSNYSVNRFMYGR